MMNKDILFEEEQRYFKRGCDFEKERNWPCAREQFNKVLNINPNNVWAHIELGKLYRNELKFDLAEGKFKEVLTMSLNPEQEEEAYICLGIVCWLQGSYEVAMQEFKEALKINPYNQRLAYWIKEKSNQVNGFRREIAPYRVFFTWGMHYQCNYRCSYCNAPKPENAGFNEKEQNRATYLGIKEWICAWNNIYKKYGSCRIRLDGGEPSIYPYFTELVAEMSKQHLLQINTNLSFNVLNFVKKVSPDRVCIDASFHPEFLDFEDFLHKILVFKEHGFKIVLSCVAYPPFLDKINDYKKPFATLDIPFIIHPFSGDFNGKTYPKDYELEEVSKIYSLDKASELIMGWRRGEKNVTRGKLCRMGQIYGRIYPNGAVYRCCADGGMLKIGNICDNNFQLLDEPLECNSENCPCWKCMVIDEERRWTSLWLDDWEMPPVSKGTNIDVTRDKQIYLNSGYSFREKGNYELAIREFKKLLDIEPHNEMAILETGKTYKIMAEYKEAIDKFILLLRINPNNKEAIIELGETSHISNNWQLAMEELQKTAREFSVNEHVYIEISKIFHKNAEYDKAFKELYKALAINKANSEIYVGLGQLYKETGEGGKAISSFKEAIKMNPGNKNAHIQMVKFYEEKKEYCEAINELKEVLKIDPTDIKSRLNLVKIYALTNEITFSNNEVQKILELTPSDPFLKDSMLNEIEFQQKKVFLESKIKSLQVTLTTRCNLKCKICGIWKAAPWDIPKKTIDEVIELFPYLERVGWIGGEIFLYKYFEELFQKALTFPHLQQQIITNGVILTKEWIEKITQANNVELTISIDGANKDVYEYIRMGASFEKLIANLHLINKLRKKYNSKIRMILNTVLIRSNYHQLEKFVDFAKEHSFDQMSLMAVHFDLSPDENIFYTHKDPKIFSYIADNIPKIKEKARTYGIKLDILLPQENLDFNVSEKQDNLISFPRRNFSCSAPWKWMLVADGGKVLPTGSCKKVIGNIHENSLNEIWNSEQMQLYRKELLTGIKPELCMSECTTRDKDFS